MKKLFVILFALLLSLGVAAQQVAASPTATMGAAAATPSLVGLYDGKMVGNYTSGTTVFWIAIDQQAGETLSGRANFYYGLRACRGGAGGLPFSGTIKDGVMILNIEARTLGCGRIITAHQVADGRWIGTLPPQDGMRTVPWDVALTRTQQQ